MSSPETIDVLNQILGILSRSFSQYLKYARPYIPPAHQRVTETLEEIVLGQEALADRISQLITDSGAVPRRGNFPIEYTSAHDLGIDYLIAQTIAYGRRDLMRLEKCAAELGLAPAASALAHEAVGMTKGHLESLEELSQDRAVV